MTDESQKKVITDDLEIIDFIRILHKSKEKIWLWQQIPNSSGERPVHFCQIRKFDVLKKLIELTPLSDEGFSFTDKNADLFLYSRKKNTAFKFKPRELEGHYIMLSVPEKLNHLSEELAAKISLVEEENESEKMHLRQQPRKSAGENQTVTLSKTQGNNRPKQYPLYDISAGGLALKTPDPGIFKKDDELTITSINSQELPQAISGKVVSIRHMTEDDLFKVGVQFIKN